MNATVKVAGSEPLRVLDLNCRISNRLASEGIFRIADLCVRSARDLMRLPGFGKKSLREVEAALQRAGRSLRDEDTP